jgi:hypothetical protein
VIIIRHILFKNSKEHPKNCVLMQILSLKHIHLQQILLKLRKRSWIKITYDGYCEVKTFKCAIVIIFIKEANYLANIMEQRQLYNTVTSWQTIVQKMCNAGSRHQWLKSEINTRTKGLTKNAKRKLRKKNYDRISPLSGEKFCSIS